MSSDPRPIPASEFPPPPTHLAPLTPRTTDELATEEKSRSFSAGGSSAESDAGFRSLFRRRLLVLNILYGFIVCYLFVLPDLLHIEVGPYHVCGAPGRVIGIAAMIVNGGLAVWLLRSRSPVPSALRTIELSILGYTVLFLATWQYEEFSRLSDHPLWKGAYGRLLYKDMLARASAYANSTHWFVIIILYGLLIPNTWRRCAVVCLATSFVPLLVHWAVFPTMQMIAVKLISGAVTGCALASGLAVFGSYKISTLQDEVKSVRRQVRALGQYQLKRRLGGGGMGEVFLAEHSRLKRPCAVKFIRSEMTAHANYLARFEREAQVMAGLSHPNIVEIYDYGHSEDGIFYYAMEYLPGLNLQQLIARAGPLPPGRAVYLLRQVSAALREAHAFGLIHRDIKPSNIFVTERGGRADVVKLLDFGLVRGPGELEGRLTQTGLILGTPGYMSPEQAAGETELDARSDIYSIGAVGYVLLAGQALFADKPLWKRIAAHVLESPRVLQELRHDVPDDLSAVIARCLARDAGERLADAGQVEQAFAACACAGDWSEDKAAEWWRTMRADEPSTPSTLPT